MGAPNLLARRAQSEGLYRKSTTCTEFGWEGEIFQCLKMALVTVKGSQTRAREGEGG